MASRTNPKHLTTPKPALRFHRIRGHAETPFIVGFGSLLFGLPWATILCANHQEFAPWMRIAVFVVSPLVGFLFLMAVFASVYASILCYNFIGEWLGNRIERWRRSKKD